MSDAFISFALLTSDSSTSEPSRRLTAMASLQRMIASIVGVASCTDLTSTSAVRIDIAA